MSGRLGHSIYIRLSFLLGSDCLGDRDDMSLSLGEEHRLTLARLQTTSCTIHNFGRMMLLNLDRGVHCNKTQCVVFSDVQSSYDIRYLYLDPSHRHKFFLLYISTPRKVSELA